MTTVRQLTEKGVRPDWTSSNRDPVITASARLGCFTRVVATWHAVINFLVLIGYEDATGFHYGEPPTLNDHGKAAI